MADNIFSKVNAENTLIEKEDLSISYEKVEYLLNKDLRLAGKLLSDEQARILVDGFYTIQGARIRNENQVRELSTNDEPNQILKWFLAKNIETEKRIAIALSAFAANNTLGIWPLKVVGIGPIITSGLIAHIDLAKARTPEAIWRYCGLDPTVKWEPHAKRPWNAEAKKLCWKIGESFVMYRGNIWKPEESYLSLDDRLVEWKATDQKKRQPKIGDRVRKTILDTGELFECVQSGVSGTQEPRWPKKVGSTVKDGDVVWKLTNTMTKDYYGHLYDLRKNLEIWRNNNGLYQHSAENELRAKKYKTNTVTYKRLIEGKLSDNHIHARARRHTVQIFLSHYHEVNYILVNGRPSPGPYAVNILKHAHYLPPPYTKPDSELHNSIFPTYSYTKYLE